MRKPSARIAVAALAIPLFGGFATYAAAQVSTRPSPQVVIPGALTSSTAKTSSTVKTSSTLPGHDANDDHGRDGTNTSSTVPGHDANDDHGGEGANTSSTLPGHDVNDDHGGLQNSGVSNSGPGGGADDPANHDANDDRTSTSVPKSTVPTQVTTPNTVDDHGGDSGNRGPGGGGHDG